MNKTLTFSVNGNVGLTIAFGLFVATVALIPTSIVAYQWLTATSPAQIHTDPLAIVPGLAIVLWGLAMGTKRKTVTVNAEDGTLTFRSSIFGVTFRTEVWQRGEIEAIEIVRTSDVHRNYRVFLQGKNRSQILVEESRRDDPKQVRETANLLHLTVRYPQYPNKKWHG